MTTHDPAIQLARHPVGSPRFIVHSIDDAGTVYEPVVIVAHFVKHEQCPECQGHCCLGLPGTGAPPCDRCDAKGHTNSAFVELRRAMGGIEVRRPEQIYGTLWVERGYPRDLKPDVPTDLAVSMAVVELIEAAERDESASPKWATERGALLRQVADWLGWLVDQKGTSERSERTRATSSASRIEP